MAYAQAGDPSEFTGLTGWVAGVIELARRGRRRRCWWRWRTSFRRSPARSCWRWPATWPARAGSTWCWWCSPRPSARWSARWCSTGSARRSARSGCKRWLDRIPLVDADDLDKADRWFERHGRWAVLFGRMVPVVRSLVSIPAGANQMPMGGFILLTAIGSGVWNALFVGRRLRARHAGGSRSSSTPTGSTTRSSRSSRSWSASWVIRRSATAGTARPAVGDRRSLIALPPSRSTNRLRAAASAAEGEPVDVDEVGRLAAGEGQVDRVRAGHRRHVAGDRPPALPAAGVGRPRSCRSARAVGCPAAPRPGR